MLKNPALGIDYGNGIRKIRIAPQSSTKGKSGGLRIITYQEIIVKEVDGVIYLITMWAKNERASMNKSEVIELLKDIGII